jgi:hypothetical protein
MSPLPPVRWGFPICPSAQPAIKSRLSNLFEREIEKRTGTPTPYGKSIRKRARTNPIKQEGRMMTSIG